MTARMHCTSALHKVAAHAYFKAVPLASLARCCVVLAAGARGGRTVRLMGRREIWSGTNTGVQDVAVLALQSVQLRTGCAYSSFSYC